MNTAPAATPPHIGLHGNVWLTVDGHNFGGAGRIELLERIAQSGSISQAARDMGMAYKTAWDAIDAMNNLSHEPLVARSAGGKGGGGTQLTRRGAQLVHNFAAIVQEHRRFMAALQQQAQGIAEDYLLIRRMGMKTSARNQYAGIVSRVTPGAVYDEIDIEITGGQHIVATVTSESARNLALEAGAQVFALIKASSVILAVPGQGMRFSARNCLSGVVQDICEGAINDEIAIALPGGATVVATITRASRSALELQIGSRASALFKAGSVIVGVPD